MTNQNDITKLPQWAQRLISRLEQDNASLKNQLQAVSEADSPVTWRYVSEDYGIPKGATVSFKMWRRHGLDVKLADDGNGIEVYASGGTSIRIKPMYSNAVLIQLDSIEKMRQWQAMGESEATE
jgi:hypothetical protein